DVALLTIGPIGKSMAGVIDEAAAHGVSVAHYDMRFLKPIDEELLHEAGRKFKRIVTLEDGVRMGGLGSAVAEFMAANHYTADVRIMGIPDTFVEHGAPSALYKLCGMDRESVLKAILG
ncbi:MAG: 1-deoxy-D-xylulose-5-phosphate synthase, partial [Oscillospiraceae bacterium]|nr:1-deoxy-D-xylulose-5-phosphate synthase [Oscillospiraceae bacterium]